MFLFASLAIGFGLIFIAAFLQPVFTARFGRAYEAVQGEITKSELQQGMFDKRDPDRAITHYSYDIEYEYKYGTEIYKSSKIYRYLEYSSSEKSSVTAVLQKYPVAKDVQVYVNPNNWADSYLELNPKGTPVFVLILGIISFMVGAAMFAFASHF